MKEKLFILGGDSELIWYIQFQEGGGRSSHILRLPAIITEILLKGSKSTNNYLLKAGQVVNSPSDYLLGGKAPVERLPLVQVLLY